MNTKNNSTSTTTTPSEIIKKTLNDEDQIESLEWQSSLKNDDFVAESGYQSKQALPEVDELKVTSPHQKDDEFTTAVAVAEESGRERLKRHRVEMAGRVWIPDIWGQEDLLKDWIDCTAFDASLVNNSIMSARAALVQERTAASSSVLRIENSDES